VGVVSYRIAQYWLPILIGGACYLSLRIGPWAIARNKLEPLRDVVATMATGDEDILDFSERFPAKERTGQLRQPSVEQIQASQIQNKENPQSHD
jgi:hypothetical protein